MSKKAVKKSAEPATRVAAKIVLVGDGNVGKSTLGRWLAYGAAGLNGTHDKKPIWHLPKLGKSFPTVPGTMRFYGTSKVIRTSLILPLWLADADIALVLFDPTPKNDPLAKVVYWLRGAGSPERGKLPEDSGGHPNRPRYPHLDGV